ncbi:hypothetical protein FB471_3388 [Amycolatopsis cihanbeyliensis]|uniref:Uncharacterized protein n=1 Tax=Amycolatopsis cihanbeyliensis TaxID=1128664 RepID=A0A542DKK6_AMYCI|nr:hypothetical protein FB471_3388 [Amycolatopsis cihanbeyliensis]
MGAEKVAYVFGHIGGYLACATNFAGYILDFGN